MLQYEKGDTSVLFTPVNYTGRGAAGRVKGLKQSGNN